MAILELVQGLHSTDSSNSHPTKTSATERRRSRPRRHLWWNVPPDNDVLRGTVLEAVAVTRRMTVERKWGAARYTVLVLASLLIMGSGFWALLGLAAIGSDLCEASDPLRLDECNGQLAGEVMRSALSVAFGGGGIAVATKARTVENVWKGGIVLLIGGLLSSPLVLVIG